MQSEGESEIRLESGKSEKRVRGRARSGGGGKRGGVRVVRKGGPIRDRFASKRGKSNR